MIRNIIFIMVTPFNKRDYNRFGIKLLENNGFHVDVWDVSPIAHPKLYTEYKPPDPISFPNHYLFKDKCNFYKEIRKLNSSSFVITFHYTKKYFFIYKGITSSNLKYGVFMANAIPSPKKKKKKNKQRKLIGVIRGLSEMKNEDLNKLFKKFYKYSSAHLFYKMPASFFGIEPADLVFAGGKKSLKYRCPKDHNTEILWAHTLDYDLYLEEKKNIYSEKNIAVFLDEYLPFHPDYLISGRSPPEKAEKYYNDLNDFFNRLEKQTGLKVIIAAHPRSNYNKHQDFFGKRKCIRNKTIDLIKKSQLVLSHSSTALNFANLFRKPVIFLTSKNIDNSWQGPLIRKMADCFGKKPIFVDKKNSISWQEQIRIDKEKYKQYRRNYIKTDNSKDIPFWQIVADRLKKE